MFKDLRNDDQFTSKSSTPSDMVLFLVFGLVCCMLPAIGQSGYVDFLDGELIYYTDKESNRIPDYSYAGYRGGTVEIPNYPVVKTLSPVEGDNTVHIQLALDELAGMPLDSAGIRGAILLGPGTYPIHGSLQIGADGIVLRGTKQDNDEQLLTTLIGIGNSPNQRDLIVLGGISDASWRNGLDANRYDITSPFLPVGSRTLEINTVEGLQVGDEIIVRHPSTEDWLESIDYGSTATDDPWKPGNIDMFLNRTITEIFPAQNKIVLDAPVYDHFNKTLSGATLYRWDDRNIIRESGIEDIEIIEKTAGVESEDNVWTTIYLRGAKDCWVQGVKSAHFGYAAVNISVGNRITVRDCQGLEPHSPVEGGNRYNFAVNRYANNVLFLNCAASYGRHAFVSNGASYASGMVFHNVSSTHDQTSSEGHRLWSQGLLFDNFKIDSADAERVLALYNRGSYGTAHGWSAVHSTAWNVSIPSGSSMVLQKPPGRQNYAIGVQGYVTRLGPFTHRGGHQAMSNLVPQPSSLYQTQLTSRVESGPLPDAPAKFQVVRMETGTVLQWLDISAQEESYVIEYRSDDSAVFREMVRLGENQDSFLIPEEKVMPGSVWRVYAVEAGRNSPYSNEAEIEETTTTHSFQAVSLEVYPNPFRNRISVRTSQGIRSIDVYALDGRRLQTHQMTGVSQAAEIYVGDLQNGLYLIDVHLSNGGSQAIKLLRQ